MGWCPARILHAFKMDRITSSHTLYGQPCATCTAGIWCKPTYLTQSNTQNLVPDPSISNIKVIFH